MRNLGLLLVASALALGACKKSKSDDKAPPPPTAKKVAPDAAPVAAATPDAAPAAEPTGTGMTNRAGNCPSTVGGAVTEITKDTMDGKVQLTITAKDDAAVKTIRLRAAHLIEVQDAPDETVKHTGEGTGGGGEGLCPVITASTTVTSKEVDGGVVLTMEPKDEATGKTLMKDVEGRIAKANEWAAQNIHPTGDAGGGAGVGGGKGDHGGNHQGKGNGKGKEEKETPKPE